MSDDLAKVEHRTERREACFEHYRNCKGCAYDKCKDKGKPFEELMKKFEEKIKTDSAQKKIREATTEKDGLKILLRAMANFGQLVSISEKQGVSCETLNDWLDNKIELSEQDRVKLSAGIAPEFSGKVNIS